MTKNSITLRRSLPVLLAAAFAFAVPMRAEDPKPADDPATSFSAVLGGQTVNDVDSRGKARFEEFRDVPEGAVFEFGRLAWDPK
jgi:hypothetical protein